MFADTTSPEGALAIFTRTVRRSLSTTAALRAVIVLSYFLYELPYLRRFSWNQEWLRLPLWDIGIADDTRTFLVLECVYVGASLLACFRRFVVAGCLVAGIASILLVSLDLSYRLQFAFLPGGALLAFAMTEILARREGPKSRVDLPFVLFLGSIYGFASFHKLLNFHWMKTLLPSSVFSAPEGPVPVFCADADALFLNVIAWTVVPYEALLAVLTLTRRWLKLRLACVSLFHWLLISLVPHIWHVSLFMLSLHLYLASLQRPAAQKRLLVHRNWFVLLGAEGFFIGANLLAPSLAGPAGRVLGAVAFASLTLFPVFFFFWTFWRAESEPVDARSFVPRGFHGAVATAFGVLVLGFGLSPFLLDKEYSVLSLGWAMFAGGEYRDGSYFILKTPASPCFLYPMVDSMIWRQATDRQIQYLSFRKLDLERLKRFLERRRCGGPPLQIETARF